MPANIKDSMISELTALNRAMMLSIDVIPVPTDEAVREMQNRLLGVETNVTNWQRRQNSNNNFSAVVPYDMEQQRKETREMLDDLTTRDQPMLFAVVTLVHLADSKEQLDSDTETLQSIARKHLCQLSTLNWQQADGLVTALPLGLRRIDALRTLTTEALAVLMPFKAQEVSRISRTGWKGTGSDQESHTQLQHGCGSSHTFAHRNGPARDIRDCLPNDQDEGCLHPAADSQRSGAAVPDDHPGAAPILGKCVCRIHREDGGSGRRRGCGHPGRGPRGAPADGVLGYDRDHHPDHNGERPGQRK
jgi:hypothetical protein